MRAVSDKSRAAFCSLPSPCSIVKLLKAQIYGVINARGSAEYFTAPSFGERLVWRSGESRARGGTPSGIAARLQLEDGGSQGTGTAGSGAARSCATTQVGPGTPRPWHAGCPSPSGQRESADSPPFLWPVAGFGSICRPDCATACRGARARTCQPRGGVRPGPAPGALPPCTPATRSPAGCRRLLGGRLRPRRDGLGDAGKQLCPAPLPLASQQEVCSLGAARAMRA